MVDLIDALSHPEVSEWLEVLSNCKSGSGRSPRREPEPALRRPFGEVADAVLQVLQEADTELSYIEIYRAVNDQLRGDVSKSSVKNALVRARSGSHPPLIRVSPGRYVALPKNTNARVLG